MDRHSAVSQQHDDEGRWKKKVILLAAGKPGLPKPPLSSPPVSLQLSRNIHQELARSDQPLASSQDLFAGRLDYTIVLPASVVEERVMIPCSIRFKRSTIVLLGTS